MLASSVAESMKQWTDMCSSVSLTAVFDAARIVCGAGSM